MFVEVIIKLVNRGRLNLGLNLSCGIRLLSYFVLVSAISASFNSSKDRILFFSCCRFFFCFSFCRWLMSFLKKKGNKTKDRIGLSAKTSCSSHLCLHIFRSYLIADFEELMNVTNALKCMNRNQRIISD